MKKQFILAACLGAFACACQPQAANKTNPPDDSNYHERRADKPQGGCCELEKPKTAVPEGQVVLAPTVKTVEVKAPEVTVETAK